MTDIFTAWRERSRLRWIEIALEFGPLWNQRSVEVVADPDWFDRRMVSERAGWSHMSAMDIIALEAFQ
jgi:hypothetical protein